MSDIIIKEIYRNRKKCKMDNEINGVQTSKFIVQSKKTSKFIVVTGECTAGSARILTSSDLLQLYISFIVCFRRFHGMALSASDDKPPENSLAKPQRHHLLLLLEQLVLLLLLILLVIPFRPLLRVVPSSYSLRGITVQCRRRHGRYILPPLRAPVIRTTRNH